MGTEVSRSKKVTFEKSSLIAQEAWLCVLFLKSGRAHREYSRVRGKRIQVHPAKLGEAEKRVRSAALPSLSLPPRPCVSSRIVSRKQKTGSLCPAFKSTQSSVSSALRVLFPSTAGCRRSFSCRLPYITSRPLASPHFLVRYLYYLSSETTLLPLLLFSSLLHAVLDRFFSPYLYMFFFIPLYIPICTSTRSNSQLRLPRPQIPLVRITAFASPAYLCCPTKKSGMKFRIAMSKSSSRCVVRRSTASSFFPILINTVSCTTIFPNGVQYIVFRQTFLKCASIYFSYEVKCSISFFLRI